MRGALLTPESTILLLSGVAMVHKTYQRKLLKLDYEKEKFIWEE